MESINKSSIPLRGGFNDKIKFGVVTNKKSQAHEKLAEFEQQLQATEKKCKFVKNRLEYIKMVYQSVGPSGLETAVFDIPSINSSKSVLINSREIYHQDISKNFEQVNNENSPVITSAKNQVHMAGSNGNTCANYFTVRKKKTKAKKLCSHNNETRKTSRKGVSIVQLASEHVSSSSDDFNSNDNVLQPRDIFITSPPTANGCKKSQLILKITNALSSNSNGNEMRKANKLEKVTTCLSNSKLGQNKMDNNVSTSRAMKFRKRKTRMRRTHSKCVAASRPAVIIGESQFANRNSRQVNYLREIAKSESDNVTMNIVGEEKTTEQTWNEVVEIYHNTAAKNTSVSVVSSKQQFKLEEMKSFEVKNEAAAFVMVDVGETHQNIVHPAEIDQTICEPPDDDGTFRRHEKGLNVPSDKNYHGDCKQPPPVRSWYCESPAMRNYQQPTISSKLKEVNRCYFATQLNLQNIPFVVGTSVTPSHNLGLNIQQVFSLMKHRQMSMPSDIRPMLIRKTGEGIDPMIPHVRQLKVDDDGKEKRAMSSRQIMQQETQHIGDAGPSKPSNNHGDSTQVSAHITQSSMLRQREEELNKGDDGCKKYQSVTNNSGRIRNVLLRLHDQFEAMNDKYAKLQVEVQKTDDINLRKELMELDSELTVKEEEISALMDVYKEILALKQQMKLYREKNSVVCITTHSHRKHSTRVGHAISVRRSRIPHHQLQFSHSQKLRTPTSAGEPVAAPRLVGLLRQIQSFQQQLTTP